MQSDPTGKTQTSAERPTCPATLHLPRKHNAIRLHGEDASERREADVPSKSVPAPQAQREEASSAAGAATIPAARPALQSIPAARTAFAIHPSGPSSAANTARQQAADRRGLAPTAHTGGEAARQALRDRRGATSGSLAGLSALRPRVGEGCPSSAARPPRGNKRQPGGAYGPPPTRGGRRPVQLCQTKGAVGPTPPLQVQERQGCGRPIPTPAALEPTAKAARTTVQGHIYSSIHLWYISGHRFALARNIPQV